MRTWKFVLLIFLSGCDLKSHENKKIQGLNKLNVQEYSLDLNRDTLVIGAKGSQLHIPKGGFVYLNGQSYDGRGTLGLVECYTRRDILESGIETVSNGKPLVSFGFVNITMCDSMSTSLFLKDNVRIELLLDTSYFVDGFNPEIFYGLENERDKINWVQDSSFYKEPIRRDTWIGNILLIDKKGYKVSVPKLGWINLDSFFGLPEEDLVSLTVRVEREVNASVKLILLDIRSVISEQKSDKGLITFDQLPRGEKAALFIYGVEGNRAHFGYKEIVLGEDLTTDLEITYCTFEELDSMFSKLDF